ncbi:MAG TPA: NifB/NifX family molybdenum-iron cluster-binding protein [Desulfomonilia bacterium]|nr:NifB/NifX family molybdenum-iron cluster-binding protein [Desulfomonilia bacterium]
MNICIPIGENNGMGSKIYGHFGSAPYFAIYNTQSKNLEIVNNGDLHHAHGQCNPIGALAGRSVDILVTGGIGARAIERLGTMGIRVCLKDSEETIQDVITSHETNSLREIQPGQGCSHHSCS